MRKIIKLSSDDMERYAEIIESQIKITSISRKEAFNALSKALSLYVDFKEADNTENFSNLEKSLETMRDTAGVTNEKLYGFREVISNLPRLTIELNKSKQKAVKALNEVLEEFDAMVQSANNILKIIIELK